MTNASIPIAFVWNGDGMVPARGYAAQADRQYVVGQTYFMEAREERSPAAHAHYFAAVAEAFQNLSDKATERLKTPNHLRKWALIECGFYDETMLDCGSQEVALRTAAFTRAADDYAELIVRGPLLVKRVAKSQKIRTMDKEQFKKSSTAVLDLLSDMIGVNRTVLQRYAGRVA